MNNKSPAFQFYANDWLSSPKVMLMTPAQEGAYIRLLAYAWADPDCSIPDNDDELAVLSRLGEEWFKGGSTKVRNCFEPHPEIPGRLVNRRLLDERIKQQIWREKSSLGGQKSGEARRKQKTSADMKGGSSVVQPKSNSSSSSSSSSSLGDKSPKASPSAKPTKEPDALYKIFTEQFEQVAESPYLNKQADFVQLASLRKKCSGNGWELTAERFTTAVANYFASELGPFTLADLCVRFSAFFKSPLDRFGKPVNSTNGHISKSAQIQKNNLALLDEYRREAEQEVVNG